MPVDVLIKAQEPANIHGQGFQFRRGHVVEVCAHPTSWGAKEVAPMFARVTVLDSTSEAAFAQYVQPNSTEWKFSSAQLDIIMAVNGLENMTMAVFQTFMAAV